MKKLSYEKRINQMRKCRAAMRKRSRIKRIRMRRFKPRLKRRLEKSDFLIAPRHFIIYSNGRRVVQEEIDEFFSFLSRLRGTATKEIKIDMSDVNRMVADAALLFKAELSRLVERMNVRVVAKPPNSERARQVLKQTGIDELLAIRIEGRPDREDVVHWRVAEGPRETVDPAALSEIMSDIESVTGMEAHPIYQGIIESMANCVEHAYKPHSDVKREMPENPGWWVFQQVRNGILNVVVCDLGIGVRRSLPLTLAGEMGLYRKLMHLVRRAKGEDNRALLAAMEYGRSSTGERQRGKGMRNAHNVVDELGEGSFCAMSNSGCYMYTRKCGDRSGSYKTVKLRHSIEGTILGWRLPLKPQSGQESS